MRRRRTITPKGKWDTKFTIRVRNIIYKAIEARLPQRRAAELAGINDTTITMWLRKGRDPAKKKYHRFRKKVLV